MFLRTIDFWLKLDDFIFDCRPSAESMLKRAVIVMYRHATRRATGRGLPFSFLKIEKSFLILQKKGMIMSIFGLNVPFKMWF